MWTSCCGCSTPPIASEWLAYYQYWLGAKLVKGPMKDAIAAELTLHATEELGHAMLLAGPDPPAGRHAGARPEASGSR